MKRRSFCRLFICTSCLFMVGGLSAQEARRNTKFVPKALWKDTDGEHINAHGGGVLFHEGTYYWYGERRGDRTSSGGISVYSSKDLYNWKNEGAVLSPVDNPDSDITWGCVMERPKAIYNAQTRQFVLWFHLELKGQGYAAARAAVATSDTPTGPFKFIESFRPNGNMSRDMGLFVDDDGAAYHIYSSDENYALRIARLREDYLGPTTEDTLLFRNHREAPALFKHRGKYYLITSGCTGWDPNEASLHVADQLFGPWELIGDPMRGGEAKKTFGGQSTFVLPVQGKKDAFIFMADEWRPKKLQDSRYIWLPIQMHADGINIEWIDEWSLDYFN
ncbi:family 43 glycosylhydrolase [Olivibacter sp. SDN3]|uniref:glycoside hydrolase family 43 protein n=1 Tax=Olivibacter sp. SDN3 TaxID=2764720 RepID=UPI00165122DC|nr:glycoside hydrolase family 43 protein [Olivibacter sp. SDN3]QNL50740.1 family 43 glycosylhydrolase [Olivibacter sp. SDN3]